MKAQSSFGAGSAAMFSRVALGLDSARFHRCSELPSPFRVLVSWLPVQADPGRRGRVLYRRQVMEDRAGRRRSAEHLHCLRYRPRVSVDGRSGRVACLLGCLLLSTASAAESVAPATVDDAQVHRVDEVAVPADIPQGHDDGGPTQEPQSPADEKSRLLPLFRDWFEDQGIDLPLPYGVGFMTIIMERDIEVRDVTVQFLDRPPESVADRADFEVSNSTRSVAARFDAWVLPFLNVYTLVGEATTDTSLRSLIVIERPNGDPLEIEISDDTRVDGPMGGLGLTAVIGGDAWFAMADANYTYAETDLFDEEIRAWLYSGRLGWHGGTRWGPARVWGGLFYLDSERTLTITEDYPLIGTTEVRVTQRPVDPLTYQLGASLTVNRHWDLMVETGSNLDDAHMLVLSASYRF